MELNKSLCGCQLEVEISPYGFCFIRTGGKIHQREVKNTKDIGDMVRNFVEELVEEKRR